MLKIFLISIYQVLVLLTQQFVPQMKKNKKKEEN